MHLEVAYPVHTDYSNLDLIPRPASQRGPSPLERLKVISIVARKPRRKEGDKLMVTAAESKRGPSKIQSLNLSRGRVNDSQLPRVSPCLAASTPTTSITWLSFFIFRSNFLHLLISFWYIIYWSYIQYFYQHYISFSFNIIYSIFIF